MKHIYFFIILFSALIFALYVRWNYWDMHDLNRDGKVDIADWSIMDSRVFPAE